MPINQREKDYDRIITSLFNSRFKEGSSEIDFTKDELVAVARKLKITLRNPPDVVYTYRSRANLPQSILDKGNWVIKPKGKGRFSFLKSKRKPFVDIQEGLHAIEIPNALPEIVEKHASEDEQALLSSIRYNRLVDIFTEITCFHLQSHIRTPSSVKVKSRLMTYTLALTPMALSTFFPLKPRVQTTETNSAGFRFPIWSSSHARIFPSSNVILLLPSRLVTTKFT